METSPAEFHAIKATARLKRIPHDQIILYEGDRAEHAYLIKSGVVKMYDIDTNGNEKILHLAGPGSLIPFAFFRNEEWTLTWFYQAMTDVEAYVLPARELRELMAADPKMASNLVGTFATHVHELLVRLSSLNKTNVRDKLIAVLRFLATRHAEQRRGEWWRVQFSVSHQLIADMSGITRESAALGMKELQNEKIIRYPRLTVLEIHLENLTDAV